MTSAYEERHRLTWRTVQALLIAAGFCVAAVFIWDRAPVVAVMALVLFGGGGMMMLGLTIALTGKLALRVDQTGITLGGMPMRYRRTTVHVPWDKISGVAVYTVPAPGKNRCIGLAGRDGALELPGAGGRGMRRLNAWAVPHITPDVVNASRPIQGWNLDLIELEYAIDAFAPDVEFVAVN